MKTAVVAGLAATAAASSSVHAFDPAEFKLLGRSNGETMLSFTAALPARNHDKLHNKLMDVSDPDSPNYGKWLSQEEVNTLTAPDAEVRQQVSEWVTSTGARCIDWPTSLRCKAPVSAVEKLLNTRISAFHHTTRDRVVHRIHPSDKWSVPKSLDGKLMFLTNLADFPTDRRRFGKVTAVNREAQAVDYSIVLETLQNLYQYDNTGNKWADAASTGGPAEFQGDSSWAASDLEQMAQQNGVKPWTTTNVGTFDPSNPDTEATLDEQYMGAISTGNTQWYWTEADWIWEFTEHLKSLPDDKIPKVFSVSWGWYEGDQCTIDSSGACSSGSEPTNAYAYVANTNTGLAAAAARGITITVSSGDSGAHGRTDSGCSSTVTRPAFPTSSPYVTSVGATQLINGVQATNPKTPYCKNPSVTPCAQSGTEVVCSTATGALIVSGGGFSNVAAQPSWQANAVKAYLASGALLPGAGNFNASGRGYPDVSVVGHNYIIWIGGPTQVDGTSCSSPVFAGMVSLWNAQRLKAGKPVLGFLNPMLYKLGAMGGYYHDVTTGDNTCTEDGCVQGCTGFGATTGWDATTGWGTPNFSKIMSYVQSL